MHLARRLLIEGMKERIMTKNGLSNSATVLRKLRRDAEALVARGRTEVMKDVKAVRRTADRAVRDLERKVVRQFHAATDEQLKRLERRVTKLERMLGARAEKVTRVA
jgi:iron-sulfur cluster repair protein YtfE (RIC family)